VVYYNNVFIVVICLYIVGNKLFEAIDFAVKRSEECDHLDSVETEPYRNANKEVDGEWMYCKTCFRFYEVSN